MSKTRAIAPLTVRAPAMREEEKRELGQFFTPPDLAEFMASFFIRELEHWRVIDAGAGAGALTLALVQRIVQQRPLPVSFHVTAFEIDPRAVELLRDTLESCERICVGHAVSFTAEIRTEDFIAHSTAALEQGLFAPALKTFNAAIANPPYRKLRTGSPSHQRLCSIGIDATNVYSAFLALLSRLLERDGELVAIVPRSFCNGPYFRNFRHDFLARMPLRRLHVFNSRTAAFANEAVLQENIILCAERKTSRPQLVEISSSNGDFADTVTTRLLPWAEIVHPHDKEDFIRLPSGDQGEDAQSILTALPCSLTDLGLKVSTGKVVDFRSRENLRATANAGDHPLLYPCHFKDGRICWPKPGGKKPNVLAVPSDRTDLLVPIGCYVVVRRFSTKEERKRIVASLIEPERLPDETRWLGIENHLNYFHHAGHGLPYHLAKGLAAYLNWNIVDVYFRQFNGHTQVNATDLRSLPYPSITLLTKLGEKISADFPAQDELDNLVKFHLYP